MSEVYYSVGEDGYGVPTLWRHDGPDDPRPYPVDHGDVLRAAAMVYAPDEALIELVARGIHDWDPVMMTTWDDVKDNAYGQSRRGQAKSALAALRDHAAGGGTGDD